MPNFDLLEESSSRHLMPENEGSEDLAEGTVSGIPVVSGWVVVEGTHTRARTSLRRTDPDQAAGRGKVQLVAPAFNAQVTLANSILPLPVNQLIKARLVRHKHWASTTFEFHIDFVDAERLCFTARKGIKSSSITIKHANHDRGIIRLRTTDRAGNVYAFNDEKCEQEMHACITTFANTEPCTMDATVGDQKLVTRKAHFNHRCGAFVLDFQGLCDTASCKNVQLVPKDGPETLANARFILGRMSDGTFRVYFRQPFTCLQAFVTSLIVFVGSAN
eukprot:CAMPEP_0115851010 /NCGR_PEP_ID=MMETSP0287-20121206/12258_1 /TAXON_ID=412157 /ORGANISM="Chrysochromulina rotalis, Strain UIO044" /LENGTH=274 /DNA_ID=CAMNT_0003305023 /DNA_START=60 /DNA_END=884 /DNA_ORIENTATION=+